MAFTLVPYEECASNSLSSNRQYLFRLRYGRWRIVDQTMQIVHDRRPGDKDRRLSTDARRGVLRDYRSPS